MAYKKCIFVNIILLFFLCVNMFGIQLIDAQTAELKSVGSMTLQVIGSEGKVHQEETNVNVTKSVEGDGSKLQLRYDIQTPKVDDFYFVLALDSSGSLGYGGSKDQGEAVIDAVPKFIKDTVEEYKDKNISMSLISWDDNIDFAYKNFENIDPENAKIVPIQEVLKDINENVFGEIDDERFKYRIQENDRTNISKAIDASIAILNNNPENYYHRTSKFIILVTGQSEYERDNETIKRAKEAGYPIYVIAMDLDPHSRLQTDLRALSGYDENRFQNLPSVRDYLKMDLKDALATALKKAVYGPVAENFTITEPLYSYLDPEENASIEVLGYPNTKVKIKPISKNGSTVIFQSPYGLSAENITRLNFYAKFNLRGLPVSATEGSMPVVLAQPRNDTKSSCSYRWLGKEPINIDLPGNVINIESPPSTTENVPPESRRSGWDLTYITLLCFALIVILKRKN